VIFSPPDVEIMPLSPVGGRMRVAQITAPVAPADEVNGSRGLLQLRLESGHERILGGHGHAAADASNVEPNGEFIVGHDGVFLAASFLVAVIRANR
jgi:hypothetical protein